MDMMRTSRPTNQPPQGRAAEQSARSVATERVRPEPIARQPESKKSKKKPFLIIGGIVTLILIIIAVVAGYFLLNRSTAVASTVNSDKYQAVFFTNGQVYFGKLQTFTSDSMKLTDVYYLQSQGTTEEPKDPKNPQETSSDQDNSVQLIKLGNEIHGPEDEMIISKDQVLFYENLKSDGKVSQSIEKHKQGK